MTEEDEQTLITPLCLIIIRKAVNDVQEALNSGDPRQTLRALRKLVYSPGKKEICAAFEPRLKQIEEKMQLEAAGYSYTAADQWQRNKEMMVQLDIMNFELYRDVMQCLEEKHYLDFSKFKPLRAKDFEIMEGEEGGEAE